MPEPITPNAQPELVEVKISGGIVVKMTPADAEVYKSAAKKHDDHANELARTVGSIRAEKEAAEKKARDEQEAAAALKLAKDGEMGKLKELMTKEANERLTRVGSSIVSSEIRAAVASQCQGLDEVDLADIVTLVAPRARFNTERGASEYLDDAGQPLQVDGKPATADALVRDFISKRARLRPVTVPAGIQQTQQTTAATRYATSEDMAQGRVNPDDVLSGKVIIKN
jgi:septal ring-binding cell division protein DamX